MDRKLGINLDAPYTSPFQFVLIIVFNSNPTAGHNLRLARRQ